MSANPKRASYFEEEKIEIKPSTELIPDEYEHFQDSRCKIVLHTFVTDDEDDKQNENIFLETIKNFGYVLKPSNRHSLEKDNFLKSIKQLTDETSSDDAGLILFFSGVSQADGKLEVFDGKEQTFVNIQQIWLRFDSHNCPQLKNKPKIFIFILSGLFSPVQTDGKRYFGSLQTAYDTPAEADILVLCNKSDSINDDFMQNFCESINLFGDTENIVTLATCTYSTAPTLIISTLTRSFYFTFSDLRGHHLVIDKHHNDIKTHLEELKEKLNNKSAEKEKKKKGSFFQSFRIKKQTDNEKPEPSSLKNVKPSSSSTTKINSKPGPSTIPTRRQSLGQRQRGLSQSEPEGGRSSNRKPSEQKDQKKIWRP